MLSVLENKEGKKQERVAEEEKEQEGEGGGEMLFNILSEFQYAKLRRPASFDSLCVAQRKVLNTGTCMLIPSSGRREAWLNSSLLLSSTSH